MWWKGRTWEEQWISALGNSKFTVGLDSCLSILMGYFLATDLRASQHIFHSHPIPAFPSRWAFHWAWMLVLVLNDPEAASTASSFVEQVQLVRSIITSLWRVGKLLMSSWIIGVWITPVRSNNWYNYFKIFGMLLNPIRIVTNCWLITAHTIDNNLSIFGTRFALIKLQHKIIHQCIMWLPPMLPLICLTGPIPPPPSRWILRSAHMFVQMSLGWLPFWVPRVLDPLLKEITEGLGVCSDEPGRSLPQDQYVKAY